MKRLLWILCIVSPAANAGDRTVHALSLREARALVMQRHPRINAADLTVRAVEEIVRQNRAAYLPQLTGTIAGVVTGDSTGGVKASTDALQLAGIYNRASGALNVTQLITDFGRTTNLTASSRLRAEAEAQNARTTRAQILLETDAACYAILQARALLDVAEQTVKTRRLLRDNTVSLQKNQLKSAIDVSFAEVNAKDAELLLSRSQNDLKSAHATLARLLLDPEGTEYRIASPQQPVALPSKADGLIQMALNLRPELSKLRLERDAAQKFVKAENALSRPRLTLQGAAGTMPWRDRSLDQNYAAAGVVLTWPLFTGGLNTARQSEAELRAQAAGQTLKDQEASITRDVQIAWLNATNALERLNITGRLHEQSAQAYDLAEARYQAGSSSVVELSQAQLTLTAAEINQTTTRYEYLLRRSILDFQTGMMVRQNAPGSNPGAETTR
ncbi:MAG: TolC family protein [Verrucomicrobiaceae bacterium]|nr:TolC family protein [Verrucomicrobiaceae bacterium]